MPLQIFFKEINFVIVREHCQKFPENRVRHHNIAAQLGTLGKHAHDSFLAHLALQVVTPAEAAVLVAADQAEWLLEASLGVEIDEANAAYVLVFVGQRVDNVGIFVRKLLIVHETHLRFNLRLLLEPRFLNLGLVPVKEPEK